MPSFPILILGSSGAGKSTSIRTLPSANTILFNVCNKVLPFKGALKAYKEFDKTTQPSGNMITTDDYDKIKGAFKYLIKDKKEIKYVVIDDSQYLIVNEFLRNHSKNFKGDGVYSLYNQIADHFWDLIWDSKLCRDDLFIYYLHHTEYSDQGNIIPKTIGKMLNNKIDIAGMFTICLLAKREGNENWFYTQNDGTSPAKSPEGMFTELKVPNDLLYVSDAVLNYYKGELR